MRSCIKFISFTFLFLFVFVSKSWAEKVTVITPYLAQPGTQMYVEGFKEEASKKGWDLNIIDTNVDPSQIAAGLEVAAAANIPVVGMDSGANPLLVTNVTSNGYAMAAETSVYVANRIEGKGNVVMFVFDAFPPVQIRGVVADAVFGNFPDINVMDRITPDVQDGGIADSRAKMEALLAANPEAGSIAAVWAAWDQPAIGAMQAIEAAGRSDEGIVIVGIDANPQARDAIKEGGNFEASIAQDFVGIGSATANAIGRAMNGDEIKSKVIYVPTVLITNANVGD